MTAALENVMTAVRDAETDAAEKYAALIVELAGDQDRDAQEVVEIVANAGKTLADLEGAVSMLAHRRDLKARWGQHGEAVRRVRSAQSAVDDLDRECRQWLAVHALKVQAALDRAAAAREEVAACEQARAELEKTAPEHLRERRALLTSRREALQKQHAEIVKDLDRAAKIAADVPDPLSETILQNSTHPPEQEMRLARRAKYREEMARAEAAAERRDQHQREADRIESKIAALTKELAEVSAALLTP